MRQQVLVGIGVVLLALGALWWLGRGRETTESPTPIAAPARTQAAGRGTTSAPSAVRPDVAEPEAPVEPEARDQIPRELAKLIRGDPAPGGWLEEVPEIYTEEAFTETIADLLVDCDREYEIVDVTCDEAPCMVAWVAPPGAEHPASCPKWSVAFGSRAITRVAFDVDCPDGRRVHAELATPQEALLETVKDPDAWNGGRMAHRAAAYSVSDWCE